MTNVTLQPAGVKSQKHFEKSILNPIPLERIRNYLDENEYLKFLDKSTTSYPTWGLQKGKDNGNVKRWHSIQEGDLVLFTGTFKKNQGRCYCLGRIFHKKHSINLARDLGRDIWTNVGPP